MERARLLGAIKQHEAHCNKVSGAGFKVMSVLELAPGVIAVVDDDKEYCIYFDQAIPQLAEAPITDSSAEMGGMAEGVGVIQCFTANSFINITEIAKLCLQINNWHNVPVPLDY